MTTFAGGSSKQDGPIRDVWFSVYIGIMDVKAWHK